MKSFVIRNNIDHFEALLRASPDPARREAIETLLAAERAKLATLERQHPRDGAARRTDTAT